MGGDNSPKSPKCCPSFFVSRCRTVQGLAGACLEGKGAIRVTKRTGGLHNEGIWGRWSYKYKHVMCNVQRPAFHVQTDDF